MGFGRCSKGHEELLRLRRKGVNLSYNNQTQRTMTLITQGRSNIKYLLIIAIVAVIAVGGVLFLQQTAQEEMDRVGEFTDVGKPAPV